jgi:hypothetical protein
LTMPSAPTISRSWGSAASRASVNDDVVGIVQRLGDGHLLPGVVGHVIEERRVVRRRHHRADADVLQALLVDLLPQGIAEPDDVVLGGSVGGVVGRGVTAQLRGDVDDDAALLRETTMYRGMGMPYWLEKAEAQMRERG